MSHTWGFVVWYVTVLIRRLSVVSSCVRGVRHLPYLCPISLARHLRLEQLPLGYSVVQTGSRQATVHQRDGATADRGQAGAGPHPRPQQPGDVSAILLYFCRHMYPKWLNLDQSGAGRGLGVLHVAADGRARPSAPAITAMLTTLKQNTATFFFFKEPRRYLLWVLFVFFFVFWMCRHYALV